MNSQVYFENIRERIIETLDNCEFELKIAVAWFTDTKLLSKVEELSRKGVKVKIIIDDDHINQKQLFEDLYYNEAEIFLSKKLMHNKFCVIDGKTVINGSYNWTYSASSNEENINVVSNNREFAEKFENQFSKLLSKCKLIEVEISKERIILLEKEFDKFYEKRTIYDLPYLIDCTNVYYSEKNKYSVMPNGYYLINDSEFEREILWVLFVLNSDYSLKKLNRVLGKKYNIPKGYLFVDKVSFDDKIGFFQEEKILVEERKKTGYNSYSNFVFFLFKDGRKSNVIRFTHKLKLDFILTIIF
ncbi:phospholipase D-like domain-containing protein [Xanthomarina gelatinilytica]|uniref:phospholipase D-like domain-containing protein n=1 Tax=Xanthomarina gelatinilytica TaxID=1137281 RepID=UPI003AA7BD89